MRRYLAGGLILLMLMVISAACALTYSVDPSTGLYVDESGTVIDEYWDDGAGIYIVDGVAHPIQNADSVPSSGNSTPTATTPPANSSASQNPDGSASNSTCDISSITWMMTMKKIASVFA